MTAAVALTSLAKNSDVVVVVIREGKKPTVELKATVVVTIGSPYRVQVDDAEESCQATHGARAAQAAAQATVLDAGTGSVGKSAPVAMRRSSHCLAPIVGAGRHCEAAVAPRAAVMPLNGQRVQGADDAAAAENVPLPHVAQRPVVRSTPKPGEHTPTEQSEASAAPEPGVVVCAGHG